MTRIGFLHTSPVHVSTFDALLAELVPTAELVHAVDESLLHDARHHGLRSVTDRVRAHLHRLQDEGSGIICCTCSTIGDIAERNAPGVPVVRVDRPMAARAVRSGRRITIVAALDSTLAPTRALLEQEATAAGQDITVVSIRADNAWELFENGDHAGYLERIADTARHAASTGDVVVLAQASMAGAEPFLRDLSVPVLSSPRPAAEYLAGNC